MNAYCCEFHMQRSCICAFNSNGAQLTQQFKVGVQNYGIRAALQRQYTRNSSYVLQQLAAYTQRRNECYFFSHASFQFWSNEISQLHSLCACMCSVFSIHRSTRIQVTQNYQTEKTEKQHQLRSTIKNIQTHSEREQSERRDKRTRNRHIGAIKTATRELVFFVSSVFFPSFIFRS